MSKYVKNLISGHLRETLEGVRDLVVVNVVGMEAKAATRLRAELRGKNIRLMAIKNSLAARAAQGTALEPAFENLTGPAAVCWGAEDIVSLTKEITRLAKDAKFAPFEARGGVMDGEKLTAEQVTEISQWPSREEQLSLLMGQILSVGSTLSSQLLGPGGQLASQIQTKSEEQDAPDGEGE
jgi:ribosomal protein L10